MVILMPSTTSIKAQISCGSESHIVPLWCTPVLWSVILRICLVFNWMEYLDLILKVDPLLVAGEWI
jgi:hypothetical protein